MSKVITDFIETVFDVSDIPHQQFVNAGKFSSDILCSHPLLAPNFVFHNMWQFFFGSFAPKRYFAEFWKKNNNKNINIEDLLKSEQFQLATKMLPLYNEASFNGYIQDILKKASTNTYAKEFIVKKLCLRMGQEFHSNMLHENPILLYAQFLKTQEQQSDVDINPVSKHYVEIKDQIHTTKWDNIHDCIVTDRHFVYKLINNPLILVECECEEYIIQNLVTLFREVSQCRPVILNVSQKTYTVDTYCFNTEACVLKYIPSVASHFVYISDKLYPEARPLCREKKNAIYYLRAWGENDIQKNSPTIFKGLYDRYITNFPKKLTNPPLKTYRILDPIKYVEKTPASLQKILVGSQSTAHEDSHCTMPDTPKRVEVFTPINKHVHYDIVIDKHKEIPLKRIYEYMVNGAEIKYADNIFIVPKPFAKVLFSQEMFSRSWKDHIRYTCPVQEASNPMNNSLLLHEFILNYIESKCNQPLPPYGSNKENTVVIIDNRCNPYTLLSVLFVLVNTAHSKWCCKVLTGQKAESYYSEGLKDLGVEVVKIPEADTTNFDIDTYNTILKSTKTWDIIGGKKVLIIQEDGFLMRKGVEQFLDVDYVGAPWVDAETNAYIKEYVNPMLVGNGGFSLRDAQKSKMITEKYEKEKYTLFYDNQVEIPEDVYFVQCLIEEDAHLPDTNRASLFASEQILNLKSLGFHKAWVYHPREHVEAFFNSYLA